jgi:hypothetical protein
MTISRALYYLKLGPCALPTLLYPVFFVLPSNPYSISLTVVGAIEESIKT